MAFCNHCGSQLPEGAPTCPTCGAPVGSGNAQQNFQQSTQNQTDKGVTFGNAKNLTEDFDPNDLASSNKWAYILAYLWILFFLPLVVCPDSKVGKFHANQGLVMLIFSFAVGIISAIVGAFALIPVPIVSSIFATLSRLISLAGGLIHLIVFFYELVNILNNQAVEIPILGKFKLNK